MSPNTDTAVRTTHVDTAPSGDGWWIVTEESARNPGANISYTQGLASEFGQPELVVRGLRPHQARGMLTRVAEFLVRGLGFDGGVPTRITAGHYTIELSQLDRDEWVPAPDGAGRVRTVEIVWSSDLVESA